MKKLVKAPGGRQSDKHQSRFQELWIQAVATTANIAALSCELDSLVARVESELAPVEREVGALIRQVLERQLDFSMRKTLRKWQRIELEHRIADLVSDLVSMDLLDAELHERLAMRRAVARGFQPAADSELAVEDQLECFLEPENEDVVEQMRDIPDAEATDEYTAAPNLDDSLFKRLFRQAAAALHPDRETDLDRLTEKHELMVRLLRARDERDLITLLQLHERYTDAESGLSSADETQLEIVLLEHLEVLRLRREAIIYQSHQHFMTYLRFYSSKPADTDVRIASHIELLKSRESPLRHFISEVRTLKALQEYLSQPDTCDYPIGY